jgi:hypothetical protein
MGRILGRIQKISILATKIDEFKVQRLKEFLESKLKVNFANSLVASLVAQALLGGQLNGNEHGVFLWIRPRALYFLNPDTSELTHDPKFWYDNHDLWYLIQNVQVEAKELLHEFKLRDDGN